MGKSFKGKERKEAKKVAKRRKCVRDSKGRS